MQAKFVIVLAVFRRQFYKWGMTHVHTLPCTICLVLSRTRHLCVMPVWTTCACDIESEQHGSSMAVLRISLAAVTKHIALMCTTLSHVHAGVKGWRRDAASPLLLARDEPHHAVHQSAGGCAQRDGMQCAHRCLPPASVLGHQRWSVDVIIM